MQEWNDPSSLTLDIQSVLNLWWHCMKIFPRPRLCHCKTILRFGSLWLSISCIRIFPSPIDPFVHGQCFPLSSLLGPKSFNLWIEILLNPTVLTNYTHLLRPIWSLQAYEPYWAKLVRSLGTCSHPLGPTLVGLVYHNCLWPVLVIFSTQPLEC